MVLYLLLLWDHHLDVFYIIKVYEYGYHLTHEAQNLSEIQLNKNYSEKILNTLAEIIFLALKREHLPLTDISFVDKIIDMVFKTNENYFIICSIFYKSLDRRE